MHKKKRIDIFCSELRHWFSIHKRTLPWRDLKVRDRNHRAYLVLVSEIMLQQTQVSRVIILYKNFIHTFPRISGLAKASNREVLIAWRGLGYNSRALRLRDAARMVVEQGKRIQRIQRNQGNQGARESLDSLDPLVTLESFFPTSMSDLQSLPGIGHYTAGAIRNFAFDLPTACIDTNIRRILHRCFIGSEGIDGIFKTSDKKLLVLLEDMMAEALDSGWSAKDFYAALMDFGSLVCTKNNPKWHLMPVRMRPIFKAYGKKIVARKVPSRREPGREVAGKFIPNRIFRGRIVDALRDEKRGLTLDQIGSRITLDWPFGDHREWLLGLLKKLVNDDIIELKREKYLLSSR